MPTKTKKSFKKTESDSAYFLKLVLYVVLGSLWIKFAEPLVVGDFIINGLPFGLMLGIIFASHDHFQVDRKIEYAILVLMTILTYFLPAGILI
jgi:hypothetical protein